MSDGIDIAISLLQSAGYNCPHEYGKECVESKSERDSILCRRNGRKCWMKYIKTDINNNGEIQL